MKTLFLPILLLLTAANAQAQSHAASVYEWQQRYKRDFITDERSPLKSADTGFLRFYPPAESGRVLAQVALLRNASVVEMATHSGKTKRFRPFAQLRFEPPGEHGRLLTLIAYQSETGDANALFIPFNDLTNGEETYGGGRYLDKNMSDLRGDGKTAVMMIDFNKAYNPYCAFSEGYSCPIPPVQNRLNAYIRYGEMMPAPPLHKEE